MPYQFNITTTDSKIISKTMELNGQMTLKDLKIKLIGPIISTVGFDKVKFFQTGKQFTDENLVSEFKETERILIFPMIPSIRTILVSSFEDDTSDDEANETNEEVIPSPVVDDEDEPELELKTSQEVIEEINETISLFSKPSISKLMEIYLKNKDEFMEFITYLSKGDYNQVSTDFKVEYPIEIYDKIRSTFVNFNDKSNEEIKQELDKYGGNLDIMISHSFE